LERAAAGLYLAETPVYAVVTEVSAATGGGL